MSGSATTELIQEYINDFYGTLLMYVDLLMIRADDKDIDTIAEQATSAIISDPRGALRWKHIVLPKSEVMVQKTFSKLKSTIGNKFNIITLFNKFIDIGTRYKNSRNDDKNVVSLQRQLFEEATAFLKESNVNGKEISILETVRDHYGPFGCHPSVCFLVGMLCYKSGHRDNLKHAYELFEYARKGIFLDPTCQVLQAIILFWGGKCGKFSIFNKSYSYPDVEKFVLKYVLDQLLQALNSADAVDSTSMAVESSLLIDLHAAICLVYFFLCWNGETLVKSTEHFTKALTLFASINEEKPLESSPPILLLRAGRALNLPVAGMKNWINMLSSPMKPWDSGAIILEIESVANDNSSFKNVDDVMNSWWYKLSTTDFNAAPLKICETCGCGADRKCAACKKVYYCSQYCQKADWFILHKVICTQICK